MYTVKPESYSPTHFIVQKWIQLQSLAIRAGNQKETARAEGERFGIIRGMGEGLSAYLTEERCKRLSKWDYVGMVDTHDCEKFLRDAVLAYETSYGELPASKKDITNEMQAEADRKFFEWFNAAVENLIMPYELKESEENRHRKAVMEGTEKPVPEDVLWLEAALEAQSQTADRLRDLYSAIPTSK